MYQGASALLGVGLIRLQPGVAAIIIPPPMILRKSRFCIISGPRKLIGRELLLDAALMIGTTKNVYELYENSSAKTISGEVDYPFSLLTMNL